MLASAHICIAFRSWCDFRLRSLLSHPDSHKSFFVIQPYVVFTSGNVTSIACQLSTRSTVQLFVWCHMHRWLLGEFHWRCLQNVLVPGKEISLDHIHDRFLTAAVEHLCFLTSERFNQLLTHTRTIMLSWWCMFS